MNSHGVYTKIFVQTINNVSNVKKAIIELLTMIDISLNYNTNYLIDENSVYSEKINDNDFLTWLIDKSTPELNDLKRELLIKLNHATSFEENLKSILSDPSYYIIGSDLTQVYFVWNKNDYYKYKQNRLKNIKDKSLFSDELHECYQNIYFDNTVSSSLRTLGKPFNEIVDEIVNHLSKLDDFYSSFSRLLSEGHDFRDISKEFTEYSGIDCSPQASRANIKSVTRTFTNQLTGNEEKVVCELHTKFSKINRGKQKPDRLYFHPGKKNICNGKIIVIHIGEHL